MSGAVSTAAKPQLRRLLHSQIKKNLITAIGLAIAGGAAQYFFMNLPIKNKYAEFYKHYDVEKDFIRMKNLGLFDSCKPSD